MTDPDEDALDRRIADLDQRKADSDKLMKRAEGLLAIGAALRIKKALDLACRYGGIDGAHHKTWTIDQMVRALTGCPAVDWHGTDIHGTAITCKVQGESDEYTEWVRERCDGEDGPQTYEWDEGGTP